MKTKIIILLTFLGQFVFGSCSNMITNVNPSNLNVPGSKLNLNCYLSPQDDQIVAYLTESIPLFTSTDTLSKSYYIINTSTGDSVMVYSDFIKNAKIVLSNGMYSEQFKQGADGVYYLNPKEMKFKIIAGQTYTITADDSKRQVSASCTVPTTTAQFSNYNLKLDSTGTRNGNFNRYVSIETEFKDSQTQTTYYRLTGNMTVKDPSSVLNNYKSPNDLYYYLARYNPAYFTNTGLFGQNIKVLGNFNLGKIAQNKIVAIQPTIEEIILGLFVIDYNYYTFFTTLRSSINNADNPFVEPTPTFSNIKGGLGCFGAVNRSFINVPKENLPKL